jgi:hypothetical protein
LPSGDEVKTKNPPPSGSGFWLNLGHESKPSRRAGQQRVRKQQVQVLIHRDKLTGRMILVKWIQRECVSE